MHDDAWVAQVRFGLGARAGADVRDPRKAVRKSLRHLGRLPDAFAGLPDSASAIRAAAEVRALPESERRDARRDAIAEARADFADEVAARLRAAWESGGLPERLAGFFANWFTVSAVRREVAPLVGPFEREAIRPHLGGTFADLLVAAELHPAMLGYLDNIRSIGPDSPAGLRREVGLNENLAREILELHTLGVDGGYTQADVEALARVLTGWSVDRDTGRAAFYERRHQPGANTILGRKFPDDGADTAPAVLRFLATHPSTARHVTGRLTAQFLGDGASDPAIERVFADTGGHLGKTIEAIVDLDAAWTPEPRKLRTPWEFLVAMVLAFGFEPSPDAGRLAYEALQRLGQPWGHAPSPAGWPEDDASWLAPDAFVARVELAQDFAGRFADGIDPGPWSEQILGPARMPETRAVVARLDPHRAVAAVLASPEFQRR